MMVNGVPVNEMEWGGIYWSNWAGLSDVTRFIQVQRGLGASKIAVPSVGGSINIVTNTTNEALFHMGWEMTVIIRWLLASLPVC